MDKKVPASPPFWQLLFSRFNYHSRVRLLLLPYSLGIIILVALPATISFFLAFFEYDALSPPVWVGNLNFLIVYTDELFKLSIQNSVSLVLLPVPLRVLGAFLLARLMQKNDKLTSWLRAFIYLPSVIPATAYALAWLWILNPLFGPVNLLLKALHLPAPNWFADPLWAKPALILMFLWQVGEGFIVSLAALQDIPPHLEDAARIDGANPSQIIWQIILPVMSPILLILSLRDIVLTLQESFTSILLTTQGGPYYATFTLPLMVYEQGFDLLAFGKASAALWAMYLLTGVIVLILYIVARQWNINAADEVFFL